jgi:Na+-transporting methylmalonyl-CoA/oxaloacetate decarboxylase gamma subunit
MVRWMIEPELINTGIKTMAMLFIVLGVLVLVLYIMKKFISASIAKRESRSHRDIG